MAVIKDIREAEHDPLILEDKARHDEKIKEAVKKRIGDIISEQDILTGDAKKIVKVKIPSVKEPRFVFKNDGDESRVADGESDGEEGDGQPKPSTGAGNNPGVEMMEEREFKLEELIDLMLEDLELENFLNDIEVNPKDKYQPVGKRKIGPYVRLSKKETVKRQIARTRAEAKKQGRDFKAENGKKKFIENDKRYRHLRPIPDEDAKAVLFCVADLSGSMDSQRIYLARAFYFLLARSLEKKGYENLEVIFICHDSDAKEVSETEFFKRVGAGGTNLSSGQKKVLEIMEQRYGGKEVDFYVFHATDGENYIEDNDRLAEALEKVCRKSNLVGIAKVRPQGRTFDKNGNAFKKLLAEFPRFMIFNIHKKEDVGPALRKFLGKDKSKGGGK